VRGTDGGGAAVGTCGIAGAARCGAIVVVVALAADFSAAGVTTAAPFAGAAAAAIADGAAGNGVVVLAEATEDSGIAGAVVGANGVTGG
jgi:hypothetical protein